MVSLVVVSIPSSVTLPCAQVHASSHMPEDERYEGKEEWKNGGRECGRKEEGKGQWEGGKSEVRNGGKWEGTVGWRTGRMDVGREGWTEGMEGDGARK